MIQDYILGVRDSLLLARLLRQMAADLQNIAFEPVPLSNFPWVNRERLEIYQREFTALGFEPQGDYSPRPQINSVTGFMRVMGHKAEQAHVSLHATKPITSPPAPLRCAIICTLSDGWTVASTDREADPILSQLSVPHTVALRNCDVSPADLWHETWKIRAELMRDLNLHPVGDGSAQDYIAHAIKANGQRAEIVLRQNPLRFAIRRRTLMREIQPRRLLRTGEWTPQGR